MASETGQSAGPQNADAQYFDFRDFYGKREFCDRIVRLEVLEECRQASMEGTANDSSADQQTAQEPPCKKRKVADEDPTTSGRDSTLKERTAQGRVPGSSEGPNSELEPLDEWAEEIPVSSIVLAAKSPVLRTMLSNGMRESDKSALVVLKVTPQEKATFKEMLHFMYTGSLSPEFLTSDASIHCLVELLAVGDKYETNSFIAAVVKALSEREQSVSDCEVLALRVPDVLEQHSLIKQLIQKARDRLVETFKNADEWSSNEAFLLLGQDSVNFLLQSEELIADSEEEVFEGALEWLRKSVEKEPEREEAMRVFSRSIRFGRMRGEYLVDKVLSCAEMRLPESLMRATQGIYFQAYSDSKRAEVTDTVYQERRGIRNAHREIIFSFHLGEYGGEQESPKMGWLGLDWTLAMDEEEVADQFLRKTVGIFLRGVGSEESKVEVIYTLYVKTWPEGRWKFLGRSDSTVAYPVPPSGGWGTDDALKMTWEEARKSTEFVGPTGEITWKVGLYNKP